MRISRAITHPEESPYAGISWKKVDVEVCSSDPSARVCLTDIEVPAHWSYHAAETFVRYYVRRTGIPVATTRVREEGVPHWLWRSVPDIGTLMSKKEHERTGHETSAKQVFARLAGMWTYWGFKAGYFDTEADAHAFHDEICALLARQVVAPNSPQWFNAGLHWAYGMTGPAQGHFYGDFESSRLRRSLSAYERPQLHACFLHGVRDELMGDGGIMDLYEREARAFKYGSGAGSNMSAVRGAGEELSSGARSLGLMRFLGVGDKAAGAIHSGGLPRRSGKMVVVDIDHPDVMEFIRWKGEEQYKAAALITGARVMRKYLSGVMAAIAQGSKDEARFSPQQNPALKQAMERAKRALIPSSAVERVIQYARQGYRELHIPIYSAENGSEVFATISAHQTRQAVRVTDRFMEAADDKHRFALRRRTDSGIARQVDAGEVLDDLAHAVWAAGEPTIHFAETIAAAHSCPESGPVRAATPASEYFFLDDTACPLATINLVALADAKGHLDLELFTHVVRLSTIMLDLSVGIAQYPSREMARRTLDTRPVGLGFANIAALIMRMGYAYDSDEARATAAAITALMSGEAAATSAELAKELGAFAEFSKNRTAYLATVQARRTRLNPNDAINFEALPQEELLDAAKRVWDMAVIKTEVYGARNAQLSCVPPTATIARMMDCETLGLQPMSALVRYHVQPGGTLRKTLSANVTYGLQSLGYQPQQISEIAYYLCGHASLAQAPVINHDSLRAKGFGEAQLKAVDEALADAADIHTAFDPWILGERFCREQLGLGSSALYDAGFKVLEYLGYSSADIAEANRYACGAQHLFGAPHINAEDSEVFLLASGQPPRVSAAAQVRMIAAVQPFLTGGIAHTISLAHETTTVECSALIRQAWSEGCKSLSLHREGCALYEDAAAFLEEDGEEQEERLVFREAQASLSGGISEVAAQLAQRFMQSRRELPLRRAGYTQKASIGGQTFYLRTGEYEDGSLGEIFLDLPDAREDYRALAQQFARAISVALQYGVPLPAFVEAFTRAQFSPAGAVEGSNAVDEASSLLDYVFREIADSYMDEPQEESRDTNIYRLPIAALN